MDMKLASCKGESGSLGPRLQLAVQKAAIPCRSESKLSNLQLNS